MLQQSEARQDVLFVTPTLLRTHNPSVFTTVLFGRHGDKGAACRIIHMHNSLF